MPEKTADEAAVCCPNCGSADELQELSYRYTWQPVHGLKRSGDADDYGSFDYGDDVIVTGYSCRACDWEAGADLPTEQIDLLGAGAAKTLAEMPAVPQPE